MRIAIVTCMVWLVAVTAAWAPGAWGNSPVVNEPQVGMPSPSFSVVDLSGETLESGALFSSGKVTLINFWGLRCGACLEEMPHLNVLKEKFTDAVEILGVNVDAIDGPLLAEHMKKKGLEMRYRVIPDPDFRMADTFGMMAAPLTVIVDRQGVVRYRHENFEPGDETKIETVLRGLLGTGPVR